MTISIPKKLEPPNHQGLLHSRRTFETNSLYKTFVQTHSRWSRHQSSIQSRLYRTQATSQALRTTAHGGLENAPFSASSTLVAIKLYSALESQDLSAKLISLSAVGCMMGMDISSL